MPLRTKFWSRQGRRVRPVTMMAVTGTALFSCGCHSFLNSWFDPTQVGNFSRETTLDIRTTLSIQDTPLGIAGATDPQPEDLLPIYEEYHVGPGDVVVTRIFELLARGTETSTQSEVDEIGTIMIPELGSIRVGGMTRNEIERELRDQLAAREIIQEGKLTVEVPVRRDRVFKVFGAAGAPSVYPINRPNLRLLEALTMAGGLPELVTEVYVIRYQEEPAEEILPPGYEVDNQSSFTAGSAGFSYSDGYGISGGGASGRGLAQAKPSAEDEKAALIEAVEGDAASQFDGQALPDALNPSSPSDDGQWQFDSATGEWVQLGSKRDTAEPLKIADEPAQDEVAAPTFPQTTPRENLPEEVQDEPQIDWEHLAEDDQARVIRVSAQALRDGDYRQNIVVRDNDTIRLIAGQVGEYYIMGQVNRPGAYTLTGRQMTLKSAIASAGNLAPLAWPDRCTIYRRLGDREEMHQVDLDAIFAGNETDLMLKNNDLVVVGTHPVAPFLAVFRNAFRMTYGFGFVYDRNFADIDSYSAQPNPETVRLSGSNSRFPNLFR